MGEVKFACNCIVKYTWLMADANQTNTVNESSQGKYPSCPYLGIETDPSTWLSYANSGNFCHRLTPPRPVDLQHQREFCLTRAYPICKIYAQHSPAPLPSVSSVEPRGRNHTLRRLSILLVSLSVLVILIILGFWLYANWEDFSSRIFASQPTQSIATQTIIKPSPTPGFTHTPTAILGLAAGILTPEVTDEPTFTPTLAPSPTPQPSPTDLRPTPGPALNTPFGPKNQFLLHRVATGESLGNLAVIYRTSSDVIRAANVLIEGASVWPDTVLVIYPDIVDASLVRKFRVIQLKNPAFPEQIASEYQVSLAELIEYNLLDAQVQIPAGRWLVIPVSE